MCFVYQSQGQRGSATPRRGRFGEVFSTIIRTKMRVYNQQRSRITFELTISNDDDSLTDTFGQMCRAALVRRMSGSPAQSARSVERNFRSKFRDAFPGSLTQTKETTMTTIQAIRTPKLRFLLFSFSLVPHGESTTKNTCSHVGCTSHWAPATTACRLPWLGGGRARKWGPIGWKRKQHGGGHG